MSGVDLGELFFADLVRGLSEEIERVQNDDDGEDVIVDDDASAFSSLSIKEASTTGASSTI